jgi:transposase
MTRSSFWLSDETWKTLEAHLPRGKPGKPRVDDRTVISGILHPKAACKCQRENHVYSGNWL